MPYKDPIKQKEYFKQYNILNSGKRKKQRLAKKDEHIKYCKEWRKNNKEHVIQYRKNNYNTEENTEYCKKRQAKYPEYYAKYRKEYNQRKNVINRKRELNLKKKYKIDLKDYNKMFKEQKGKCAICNKHEKKLNTILYVDHCHRTNQVRGLLCNRCNSGLGYYEDFDKNAVERYLKKYRNKLN